jgi:hypothetical protein
MANSGFTGPWAADLTVLTVRMLGFAARLQDRPYTTPRLRLPVDKAGSARWLVGDAGWQVALTHVFPLLCLSCELGCAYRTSKC